MIASLIGRVARGQHASSDLSLPEARDVWHALLADDADPLQLGAFLIAERMKGESAEELAGFVLAARAYVRDYEAQPLRRGWVDLPCYAGKRRGVPAHLLAAVAVAAQGVPVVVHGVSDIAERCSAWDCLQPLGVQRAGTLAEASAIVESCGIVYCDLLDLCPPLMRVYGLRPRLGVRSFANTVARLLNPLRCEGQLNGVFHAPYVERMIAVNQLLEQPRSMVFMGAEGEPELYADRQKQVMVQQDGQASDLSLPDLGCEPYPRAAVDIEWIRHRFAQLAAGGDSGSDDVKRVQRSVHALQWASHGGEYSQFGEGVLSHG